MTTLPDLATMTDAELGAEAARRMGWRWISASPMTGEPDAWIISGQEESRACKQWNPAEILNHAAELGAAFLARWPGCHISVRIGSTGVDVAAYGVDGYAIKMIYNQSSEARARTVAVLMAWWTLDGGE